MIKSPDPTDEPPKHESAPANDAEGVKPKYAIDSMHEQMQTGESNRAESSAGLGFHLLSEFVSCIVVGAAFGYFIDWLAGTLPFGLVAMTVLGFITGVYTM
ncbi:MAG: AtpZ/AtpI family protein, partial [Alphaproteobacteria bacterium]|nr:AtpZ/AtpI family protein [Alphaproteobacteria bacterium]